MKGGRAIPLCAPARTALRGVMLSSNFSGPYPPPFLLPAHIRAFTGRNPRSALPPLALAGEAGEGWCAGRGGLPLEKTKEAQESDGLFLSHRTRNSGASHFQQPQLTPTLILPSCNLSQVLGIRTYLGGGIFCQSHRLRERPS